jgi:hypothetical protein
MAKVVFPVTKENTKKTETFTTKLVNDCVFQIENKS